MQTGSGIPFVLSAPSGTGKTTLSHRLVQEMDGLRFSVSHTTRPPRGGEREGIDYHFVKGVEFKRLVKKREFLEHAEVFGRHYGTHRDEIERAKGAGEDLLLDIDVQGGVQVKKKRRDAVLIMLLPPSMAELERRLHHRNTDDPKEIAKRLKTARWELTFAPRSLKGWPGSTRPRRWTRNGSPRKSRCSPTAATLPRRSPASRFISPQSMRC